MWAEVFEALVECALTGMFTGGFVLLFSRLGLIPCLCVPVLLVPKEENEESNEG